MNVAILDDHLLLIAGDTHEQNHFLMESREKIAEFIAPWRVVVIGPGVMFHDLRSDPALAADLDAIWVRVEAALEAK